MIMSAGNSVMSPGGPTTQANEFIRKNGRQIATGREALVVEHSALRAVVQLAEAGAALFRSAG
jgi:hypothetical protein